MFSAMPSEASVSTEALKHGHLRKYVSETDAKEYKNATWRAKSQALAAPETTTSLRHRNRHGAKTRRQAHITLVAKALSQEKKMKTNPLLDIGSHRL